MLDGDEILASFWVTEDFDDYQVAVDQEVAAEDLRILFFNDYFNPEFGIDRNLEVDFVQLNDQRLETEAPTTFSTDPAARQTRSQSAMLIE